MRAKEFTTDVLDNLIRFTEQVTFYDIHKEAFEYAEDARRLLNEDIDDTILDELREVESAKPEVGNVYYYLSAYALPAAKILSISRSSNEMLLTSVDGKYLTFTVDEKHKQYPTVGEYPRGDSNLFVYLFNSEPDMNQLLGFLTLKYKDADGWHMAVKSLQ